MEFYRHKVSLVLTIIFTFLINTLSAQELTIFSGVKGGSYYEIANDIKTIYTGEAVVKATTGSGINLEKLTAGSVAFIQFDVLQAELLSDLQNSTSKTDSIRLLMPMVREEIHIVTRSSSITSLADLEGKKVAVGLVSQGTYLTAMAMKELTGIKWIDKELSIKSAIQALFKDEIDAFFYISSAPVENLVVFSKLAPHIRNSLKLIPIENEKLKDYYEQVTIPAGTYEWAKYDVKTYAVRSVLIVNIAGETEANKKAIKQLATDIKTNIEKLKKTGHKKWTEVDFNFKPFNWAPHEAAIEIFKIK